MGPTHRKDARQSHTHIASTKQLARVLRARFERFLFASEQTLDEQTMGYVRPSSSRAELRIADSFGN